MPRVTRAGTTKRPTAQQRRAVSRLVAARIVHAIKTEFERMDFDADVGSEAVKGTPLRRVIVVAEVFRNMPFSERQDYVWRIAYDVIEPHETLMISTILTLVPRDAPKPVKKPPVRRRSPPPKKPR